MDVASLSSKRISEFTEIEHPYLKKETEERNWKGCPKSTGDSLSKLREQIQVSYHPALTLFLPQCYRQGCAGGQWMASYLYRLSGEGRVAVISPNMKHACTSTPIKWERKTWFPPSLLFLGSTRKRCVFAVPGTWQSLSKFLREVLMS